MSRTRWHPRPCARPPRKPGSKGRPASSARPPINWKRTRWARPRPRQEQARDELRDLVDAIQNRRERELSRLVKELKNAEAELAKTRARQAQNLKKTREAQQNPDAKERGEQLKRLAKEQAEIQKDLKRQLQKLAKLGADRAARAGQTASGKMGRAQDNLDDDQGDEAGKEQEEALADLEDAQEELEETRREAEEQLAMEQLARMGDRLKSLAERQEKIVTETNSYEATRQKNDGKLTIAQRAGVKGLGQVQTGIKEETADLIENLEGRRSSPSRSGALPRAWKRPPSGWPSSRPTRPPGKPPRPPPIDSSSSWNRSRPMRPAAVRAAVAAEVAAAAVAARTAATATASPRPLSSRCSSRSSKRSTIGPKRSTSCSAATKS